MDKIYSSFGYYYAQRSKRTDCVDYNIYQRANSGHTDSCIGCIRQPDKGKRFQLYTNSPYTFTSKELLELSNLIYLVNKENGLSLVD